MKDESDARSEDRPSKFTGSCLCKAIRFEVTPPSLFCAHCHCTLCRRAHGAGFVTWFSVTHEQLRVTDGESHLARYKSSDHGIRSFCDVCGSSLFFTTTEDPERLDIVLANMDGPIDLAPQAHIYFDSHVEWAPIDAGLPQLGGPTGIEPL